MILPARFLGTLVTKSISRGATAGPSRLRAKRSNSLRSAGFAQKAYGDLLATRAADVSVHGFRGDVEPAAARQAAQGAPGFLPGKLMAHLVGQVRRRLPILGGFKDASSHGSISAAPFAASGAFYSWNQRVWVSGDHRSRSSWGMEISMCLISPGVTCLANTWKTARAIVSDSPSRVPRRS